MSRVNNGLKMGLEGRVGLEEEVCSQYLTRFQINGLGAVARCKREGYKKCAQFHLGQSGKSSARVNTCRLPKMAFVKVLIDQISKQLSPIKFQPRTTLLCNCRSWCFSSQPLGFLELVNCAAMCKLIGTSVPSPTPSLSTRRPVLRSTMKVTMKVTMKDTMNSMSSLLAETRDRALMSM